MTPQDEGSKVAQPPSAVREERTGGSAGATFVAAPRLEPARKRRGRGGTRRETLVPPPPHAAPASEWRQRTLFEIWGNSGSDTMSCPSPDSPRRADVRKRTVPRDANGFKLPRMHPALSRPGSLIARVLAHVRARGPAGATRTEIAGGIGEDYSAVAQAVYELMGGYARSPRIPMLKSAGEKLSPLGTRHDLVVALEPEVPGSEFKVSSSREPRVAGNSKPETRNPKRSARPNPGSPSRHRVRGPFPKASEVAGPGTHLMKVLRFIQARGPEGATRREIVQATGLDESIVLPRVGTLLGENKQRPRRPDIKRSGRSRPGATGFPCEVLVAVGD
jgi:hypothetical protein